MEVAPWPMAMKPGSGQTSISGVGTAGSGDPVDDCTFWYVNGYYTVEGAASAPLGNGWQTRIASFKLPGC